MPLHRLAAASLCIAAAALPCAAGAAPDYAEFDKALAAFHADSGVPGLVAGVVDAQGLRHGVALGLTTFGDEGTSITLRTPFRIGSITKTMTATLLLSLRDEGVLRLDDPLPQYFPKPLPKDHPLWKVSLRHLAQHSSGLPRMSFAMDLTKPDPYGGFTEEQLLAMLEGERLWSAPGIRNTYSNIGYAALGYALGEADGRGWFPALKARILEPLHMADTTIVAPDNAARPHQGTETVPPWGSGACDPAGAVWCHAEDFARYLAWNIAARTGDTASVRASTLQEAHTPQLLVPAMKDVHVGYGWHTKDDDAARVVWHNGGTEGFRSWSGFDPARGYGVFLFVNGGAEPDATAARLLESLRAHFPPQPRPVPEDVRAIAEAIVAFANNPEDTKAVEQHFHPAFTAAVPLNQLQAMFAMAKAASGEITLQTIRPDATNGDFIGTVTTRDGSKANLFLSLTGEHPPRIGGLLLRPASE